MTNNPMRRPRQRILPEKTAAAADAQVEQPRENEAGYTVGYGKPPKEHQFKKGHRGPGRPKGRLNDNTILEKILGERIAITEDGRKKMMSKSEVYYRSLVNDAIKNKPGARNILNPMLPPQAFSRLIEYAETIVSSDDDAIIQNYLARKLNK